MLKLPFTRSRIAAEQHAERVLLHHDEAFEVGDLRLGLRERRLGALDLQLVADAALVAPREEVERLLEGRCGVARNLEFPVEFEQREIGLRDAGHEREQHTAAELLGGEQRLLRGLVRATDAAPDVEFQFTKILPGRTVARFYQIENKMDAVLRYDLAATIPVVDEKRGASEK